ncbi:MAG: molecular chaperone HscC [Lachnoclostridium edouardi]|uniref:molecular chaperone HscC n=1 Tax=Lachnoclostridium edouardi TaxID=1926283 RepID=UPI0026DAE67D|nr:molecular chaperone HscC [Lachnoclostridium edouardi]MDO4278381.1 molecular chaperone HscC [Lachnoclostridium edouardi]
MIVGIDLGTTNSLVAYFSEEGPKIIPNRLGKNLTPSVVSIDEDNNVYVGETAIERRALYPDTVADTFKRSMGSGREFKLGAKKFSAEELSSLVLKTLKEDAESYLGEQVTEAVISVPAYFDNERRKATKRAGELAGFQVERIISEPTAAAIAYGLYEKSRNTRFLVFDLGGGTFDVSILELYENILEVRAVAGDNYLGGEDFTDVMEKLFLEKVQIDKEKLDGKTRSAIRRQAEQSKKNISGKTAVTMSCSIDGEVKEAEITYSQYARECENLLERIRKSVKRSISDAHLKVKDIDVVVLVGGATKLQVIREFVVRLFCKFPDITVNPDEAVALGAAIQAAMKERNQAVKEVILTDVCSFTLGTEVVVERSKGYFEAGHFCPIIERNTVIPASRTERFYTVYDDQTQLNIRVLQGESRFADNNLLLGELHIAVPKNKAGAESVDVTYTYDINSILEVEVFVLSTGVKKKQIIKGKDNEMTDQQIAERMEELAYLKIQPRDKEENKLLLLRGERLYEESTGDVRRQIEFYMRQFEEALNSHNEGKILDAREGLRDILKEAEEELF